MIIGITGTNGAGKGTVVDYLLERGFKHYSARQVFLDEIARRGLIPDRSVIIDVANDLRATHGAAYVIETLLAQAEAVGGDAVIESIREVPGAELLKTRGALLLGVDADPRLRYERAVKRSSETDQVDFDTFIVKSSGNLRPPIRPSKIS
jgi:dephospho-CoA kinase